MARKSDSEGGAWLILIGIVIAPFVLLYEAVGQFWFWVIVLGIPALIVIRWFFKEDKMPSHVKTDGLNVINDPWFNHCAAIEEAWQRGNYDWARQQLQRIAYGMIEKSVTDEQRKDFTRLMTQFASEDPFYHQVMAKVLPMVEANPGMKQSDIYKGQPDHIKEQMRYVLYFAHELGHIHRTKKGNSYKLMLPGNMIDGEVIDTGAK